MTAAPDLERQLQKDICRYVLDPYGFAMYAYPWGEPGPLAEETGPDEWQTMILKDIGHALQHGWVDNNGRRVDCSTGIYIAVSSGHGIGKSALMAMLDQWWMSTKPNCQIVTTANTMSQLQDKTWREQAKWHNLLINRHWFEWSASKFRCLASNTWFSAAVPWSEHKPAAFAGTHEKYVLVKFDEASEIASIIWETTEGAMTESNGLKIWIAFGNPTSTTGRFAQCFGRDRKRWITYHIDSRTSKRTDKGLIQQWIDYYGEDSDFVKVRVKGEFPSAGDRQFIPAHIVEEARGKVMHPQYFMSSPRIVGVDLADYGGDQTVIVKRQGPAYFGLRKYRNPMTENWLSEVSGYIAETCREWDPDAVFIDSGNGGHYVVDKLSEWGINATAVNFGSKADDENLYANKRAEMWGRLRANLQHSGAIPNDPELVQDLVGVQYSFDPKERFLLERKDDMKKRGLDSPDSGDACALTHAYHVPNRREEYATQRTRQAVVDYDLFDPSHAPKTRPQGRQWDRLERRPARALTEYDMFGGG